MTNETERALFRKELQRLEEDYLKCDIAPLKEEIMTDIQLLSSVLSETESKIAE